MRAETLCAVTVAVALLAIITAPAPGQTPVGTTIAYQGRLTDGGTPANGTHFMGFVLFDAAEGGSLLAADEKPVPVVNGLFTVELNFGAGMFQGDARWLEITVVDPATEIAHVLSPRQALNPVPYALHALGGGGGGGFWAGINNDIYSTNSGNVGIGTPTPVARLHVAEGDVRLDMDSRLEIDAEGGFAYTMRYDAITAAGILGAPARQLELNSGWGNQLIARGGQGGIRFNIRTASDNDTTMMVVTESGSVGIGTETPGAALHIGGTAGVDGIMFPDGTLQTTAGSGGGGGIGGSGTANYLSKFTAVNAIGNSVVYETGGNVGIRTTNPKAHLHITGILGTPVPPSPRILIEAPYAPSGQHTVGLLAGGNSGDFSISRFTDSGDGLVRTDFMIEASSGDVGIGTTVPQARLHVAGTGRFATLTSHNNAATTTVEVLGQAYGNGSQINLKDSSSTTRVQLTAGNSEMKLFDDTGVTTIRLDGVDGRTVTKVLEITGGSDLSEQFNVAAFAGEAKPGMVVCIDPNSPGELIVSMKTYDRTVAGVISGAGGVSPGMLMGQKGSAADGEHPIALTGRVYCRADAADGPIIPGDLLTTSGVPGHAMKVTDHTRAQGAILGKAMSSLEAGQRGLVLTLVALQ